MPRLSPRNVILPGEFWHGATAVGLANGFRDIGWDVAPVDLMHYYLMSKTAAGRIAARLLQHSSARAYNQAILQAAANTRPEIMLAVKGTAIAPKTLDALRASGVFTTNFFPDYHFGHNGIRASDFDKYDLFVTTKSFQIPYLIERLGAERVAFVHHGYSPLAHRRQSAPGTPPDYRWDIAYCGNASPSKRDWLVAVAERFGDRKMIVVGNGWSAMARGTALEPFVLGHPLVADHYARVIEQSRINIAVHFGEDVKTGWEDHVSTRTFEIPACGGFMLHVDNAEVRSLFDVPAEIDTFATREELADKIAYYLANPDRRLQMVENAYRRCVPAYGLGQRAREIAARIEARL